jgi:hypothetical protein
MTIDRLLQRLVAGLRAAGVEFAAEDLADALYLAPRRGTGPEGRVVVTPRGPKVAADGGAGTGAKTPPRRDEGEVPGGGRLEEPGADVYLPSEEPADKSGRPFRAPAPEPLPAVAALPRAMRPLMLRGPSRTRMEFDEGETVRRVAEERLWAPALRPVLDRWIRLSIVVDIGRSMDIWRPAAR